MKLSKMTKDEIEMLSYTKIAELFLQENKVTMTTGELFAEVCKLLDLDEKEYQEKIADFFESLTTSKSFILLNNGKWDLKANHKIKIDMNEIYEDKDEEIAENEDEDLDELEEETVEDDYDSVEDADYDEDEELSDLTIVDEDELD